MPALAVILADALNILNIASLAVTVGAQAEPLIEQAVNVLKSGVALTDDERAALTTTETALRAQLNAASEPNDAA